ncbi:hypothetical protein B7495_12745 [Cryobacterium sp. LW097]|nr:hypothetical protein B7495_12745 [Cryobacterium sp. LW097]
MTPAADTSPRPGPWAPTLGVGGCAPCAHTLQSASCWRAHTTGIPLTLPLAGWYRDPEDGALLRWWTGAEWSDQRRTAEPMPVPPPAYYPERGESGETDGTIDAFATVEMTVMKNGTLTIIEASVADYELDSNGDWIGF